MRVINSRNANGKVFVQDGRRTNGTESPSLERCSTPVAKAWNLAAANLTSTTLPASGSAPRVGVPQQTTETVPNISLTLANRYVDPETGAVFGMKRLPPSLGIDPGICGQGVLAPGLALVGVPSNINLADEVAAKNILSHAVKYLLANCSMRNPMPHMETRSWLLGNVHILLYQGTNAIGEENYNSAWVVRAQVLQPNQEMRDYQNKLANVARSQAQRTNTQSSLVPRDANGFYELNLSVGGVRLNQYWPIECNARSDGLRAQSPDDDQYISSGVGFAAAESQNDLHMLLDSRFVHDLLEHVKRESRAACEDDFQMGRSNGFTSIPNSYRVSMGECYNSNPNPWMCNLVATLHRGQQEWVVQNYYRDRVLQAQAIQRAAQNEQLRAAAEKQSRHDTFAKQYRVQSWVYSEDVIANPFQFQHNPIAIYGRFVQMLSATEALFDGTHVEFRAAPSAFGAVPLPSSRGGSYIVSGVRSEQFTGNEQVVLAVRVAGTKQTSSIGTTPDLRYLGAYVCRSNCFAEIW